MKKRNTSPYHLDGIPSLKFALPLGLQHILAMFVANISPIIIVSNALNFPKEDTILLIQSCMLVSGINTFIQTYTLGSIGAKLPIVVGTSFTFVPIAISIGSKYGFEAVLGSSLIGGFFEAMLGICVKRIRKFFPPIVTGVVVLSIGLSLLPVGIENFAGGIGKFDFGSISNLFLGLCSLISIIFFRQFTKGIWSAGSIFFGIIIGTVLAFFMGKLNFSSVSNANFFILPKPFIYGFKFHLDAIFAMMLIFIVSAVETIGDMSAITMGGAGRETTDKELSGGIIADGLGSVLASCFSILPTTSFSQNTGIIAMTGIMSRFVVGLGGLFLIFGAFIPKIGAFFTSIPSSVIGGSLVMIFAMISISGINLITKEPLVGRNAIILATSLGLGYGLGNVPNALVSFPESIKLVFGDSGIVVSGSIAVFLNIILPKEKKIIKSSQEA